MSHEGAVSQPAIKVEHLGKRYRIGAESKRPDSMREAIASLASAPLRNLGRIRHLSRFREEDGADVIWAVRDVSFEVGNGEALGIIGANGAGKSTLLKILSRISKPTTGRAVVRGRIGSLLEVGTGFHMELTGRENVFLNGSILGMDRAYINRKFQEIVEFAGVGRFIDTPVKRYSSGMKVRLAFAVAAHLEPDVLVIDEVLAVGDAEFQRKCLGKMDQVAGEGRTVLFVSHDMDAITRLCGRAIRLDGGLLVDEGPAPDVVYGYLNGVDERGGSASWQGREGEGRGVELRSVRVLAEDGSVAASISVEDPLRLEIEYAVDRPGQRFRCSAGFFTQGVAAFTTVQPAEIEHASPGLYRSIVAIPANLLAEGYYSVNISVFGTRGGKVRHALKKHVVAFQVSDPVRGTSARGDYAGHLNGVMRPLLHWTHEESAGSDTQLVQSSVAAGAAGEWAEPLQIGDEET